MNGGRASAPQEGEMKRILAVVGGIGLVRSAGVSQAHADSIAQDVAYGTGSVFSTLLYAPVKGSFCILGGITSGFTLPFGGTATAGKVATAACGGAWAITPHPPHGQERRRLRC